MFQFLSQNYFYHGFIIYFQSTLIKILSETKKSYKIIVISQVKILIYFPLFSKSDLPFLIKASGLRTGIKGLKFKIAVSISKKLTEKFPAIRYDKNLRN